METQSLSSFVESDARKLNLRLARLNIEDASSMDYKKYLRSTLWKKIRAWVLNRDGEICYICLYKNFNPHKDGMEVHHRDYEIETLEGRNDAMLVTLCPHCHHRVEHYLDGARRRSLQEKEAELQRLKDLHQSIVLNGLPLRVVDASTSRRRKLNISYTGPSEFQEFYTVEQFASGLRHDYWHKNRDHLRIPLPDSRGKLHQKSGATVINRGSNRTELVIRMHDSKVEVSQPKDTMFDIALHLKTYIGSAHYWKFEVDSTWQIET